ELAGRASGHEPVDAAGDDVVGLPANAFDIDGGTVCGERGDDGGEHAAELLSGHLSSLSGSVVSESRLVWAGDAVEPARAVVLARGARWGGCSGRWSGTTGRLAMAGSVGPRFGYAEAVLRGVPSSRGTLTEAVRWEH